MLLTLWPYSLMPFEVPVRKRLECLEGHLRQRSDNSVRIQEYAQWLLGDHLYVPTRTTLHHDFVKYQSLYDDVEYGEGRSKLSLNASAMLDARRWLVGFSWSEHPLQPPISSSIARCLLLARQLKQEVSIPYLSVTGTAYRTHKGVPVGLLSGTDSAYMQLWIPDGRVMHLDLARIQGLVQWTHGDTSTYLASATDRVQLLRIKATNELLLRRLVNQFPGIVLDTATSATLQLPDSQCLMTANIIEAWMRRHVRSERQVARNVELDLSSVLTMEVSHDFRDS